MPKYIAKYIMESKVEIEAENLEEARIRAEEMSDYYIESNAIGWKTGPVEGPVLTVEQIEKLKSISPKNPSITKDDEWRNEDFWDTDSKQKIKTEDAIYRIQLILRDGNWSNKSVEALNEAIEALKYHGCGCSICLIHNDMQCPKIAR